MKFLGRNDSILLMFVLIHQWVWKLWGADRESLKKKYICGEKTKQKWSIEILHRRGSFEPGACQSSSVFLCEEMSESSLFLLHATSPQSVGKPTAQVGEKLSLWTLKEEREKKKSTLLWTFTTATYTTVVPQQSVHGNRNVKSNNMSVAHSQGGQLCFSTYHLKFTAGYIFFTFSISVENIHRCVPLGLHHTPRTTGWPFWTDDWDTFIQHYRCYHMCVCVCVRVPKYMYYF